MQSKMEYQKEIEFKSINLKEVKENIFNTIINELNLDKKNFKVKNENLKTHIKNNFDFYSGVISKFNLRISTKESMYNNYYFLTIKPFRFLLCSDEEFPINLEDSQLTFYTES